MKKILLATPLLLLAACGQMTSPAAQSDTGSSSAMLNAQKLCPGHAVIVRYDYQGPELGLIYYPAGYWIDDTADGHRAIYRWQCN